MLTFILKCLLLLPGQTHAPQCMVMLYIGDPFLVTSRCVWRIYRSASSIWKCCDLLGEPVSTLNRLVVIVSYWSGCILLVCPAPPAGRCCKVHIESYRLIRDEVWAKWRGLGLSDVMVIWWGHVLWTRLATTGLDLQQLCNCFSCLVGCECW